MVTEPQIRKALRTLAADLRVREPVDPKSSFMVKTIPPDLHSLVPETLRHCGDPSLHLSGQTYWYYRAALDLLLTHRRTDIFQTRNLTERLTEQFWSFYCEISLDDRFKSNSATEVQNQSPSWMPSLFRIWNTKPSFKYRGFQFRIDHSWEMSN